MFRNCIKKRESEHTFSNINRILTKISLTHSGIMAGKLNLWKIHRNIYHTLTFFNDWNEHNIFDYINQGSAQDFLNGGILFPLIIKIYSNQRTTHFVHC